MVVEGIIYCDVSVLREEVWRELTENLVLYVFAPHLAHPSTGPRLFAFAQYGPAVLDADSVSAELILGLAVLPLPLAGAAERLRLEAAGVLCCKPDCLGEVMFDGAEPRPCTAGSAGSGTSVAPPRPTRVCGAHAQVSKADTGIAWSRGRVIQVKQGSAAEKAGVVPGQLIVRINGKRVDGDDEIGDAIAAAPAEFALDAVPVARLMVTRPGGASACAVGARPAAAADAAKLQKDAAKGRQGRLASSGFEVAAVQVGAVSVKGSAASTTPYPPPGAKKGRRAGQTPTTVLRNTSGALKLPAWRRHRQASGPMGDHEERLVIRQEEERFVGDLYCAQQKGELPTAADLEAVRESRDPRVDVALDFSVAEVQELCQAARRQWQLSLRCRCPPAAAATAAAVTIAVAAVAARGLPPPGEPEAGSLAGTARSLLSSGYRSYRHVKPDSDLAYYSTSLNSTANSLTAAERQLLKRERQSIFTAISDAVLAERRRRIASLAQAAPREAGVPGAKGVRGDNSATRLKQARFYSRALPLPHAIKSTPDDPAGTQQLLHRTLCHITDPGDGGCAADLTLNSKLVRSQVRPTMNTAEYTLTRHEGEDFGVTLRGTRIERVEPGSAAAAAGLRRGQVIVASSGLGDSRQPTRLLSQTEAADALGGPLAPDTLTLTATCGASEGTKEGRGWDGYCCLRGSANAHVVQGIIAKRAPCPPEAVSYARGRAQAAARSEAAERSRLSAAQFRLSQTV